MNYKALLDTTSGEPHPQRVSDSGEYSNIDIADEYLTVTPTYQQSSPTSQDTYPTQMSQEDEHVYTKVQLVQGKRKSRVRTICVIVAAAVILIFLVILLYVLLRHKTDSGSDGINPCLSSPCPPDKRCVIDGASYFCDCARGFGGENCTTVLLVVPEWSHGISLIRLSEERSDKLIVTEDSAATATVDWTRNSIIYSYECCGIKALKMDRQWESSIRSEIVYTTGQQTNDLDDRVISISVDENDSTYFFSVRGMIMLVQSGRLQKSLAVCQQDQCNVTNVVVNPTERLVYFTERYGSSPVQAVKFCSYDGDICQSLTETHMDKPRAMYMDHSSQTLYWTGYDPDFTGYVYSYNVTSKGPAQQLTTSSFVGYDGIAVRDHVIYIRDDFCPVTGDPVSVLPVAGGTVTPLNITTRCHGYGLA